MDKSTSLYLDFCRFAAALTVFFHHFFTSPFYTGSTRVAFGRHAVVVFFVISGYVIAYVTDRKERDVSAYCANRASRLYSVVLPALLLTLALDFSVKILAPSLFDPAVHTVPLVRFIGSMLFLNQSWNLTMTAFSNGPFWSLCYEFWYYVIFGVLVFGSRQWRIPLAVLAALVAGPRIVLLLPVWLCGVVAYRLHQRMQQSRFGPLLFIVSASSFVLISTGRMPLVDAAVQQFAGQLSDGYLFGASRYRIFIGGDVSFPADFALAIAFSLTVVSARSVANYIMVGSTLARAIRACASYTFSLYLFHAPLLLFFAALTFSIDAGWLKNLLVLVSTLGAVYVLGSITELRRATYRRLFAALFKPRAKEVC